MTGLRHNPSASAACVSVPVRVHRFETGGEPPASRAVPVETPVNVTYGGVPFAVMMATPADLEDFALGFSLTEGVISGRADVRRVWTERADNGLKLHLDLSPACFQRLLARRRALSGRTSCGICGVEDLASLPHSTRSTAAPAQVRTAAVQRALLAIPALQVQNALTRAMHAAAWATWDGEVTCLREDAGRHNALDKLIGALLAGDADPGEGFVVVSSRCSFEMVEKAAAFGAGTLVAMSAPTSLGVERAQHHEMTLIGVARPDAMTVFTGDVIS